MTRTCTTVSTPNCPPMLNSPPTLSSLPEKTGRNLSADWESYLNHIGQTIALEEAPEYLIRRFLGWLYFIATEHQGTQDLIGCAPIGPHESMRFHQNAPLFRTYLAEHQLLRQHTAHLITNVFPQVEPSVLHEPEEVILGFIHMQNTRIPDARSRIQACFLVAASVASMPVEASDLLPCKIGFHSGQFLRYRDVQFSASKSGDRFHFYATLRLRIRGGLTHTLVSFPGQSSICPIAYLFSIGFLDGVFQGFENAKDLSSLPDGETVFRYKHTCEDLPVLKGTVSDSYMVYEDWMSMERDAISSLGLSWSARLQRGGTISFTQTKAAKRLFNTWVDIVSTNSSCHIPRPRVPAYAGSATETDDHFKMLVRFIGLLIHNAQPHNEQRLRGVDRSSYPDRQKRAMARFLNSFVTRHCRWEGCKHRFASGSRAEVALHLDSNHSFASSHRCLWDLCNATYSDQASAARHVYEVHTIFTQSLLVSATASSCSLCGDTPVSTVITPAWEMHCSNHLRSLDLHCGMRIGHGRVTQEGLCPFCLGDEQLSCADRTRSFNDEREHCLHILQHVQDIGRFNCPHPRCDSVLLDNFGDFRSHCAGHHGLLLNPTVDGAALTGRHGLSLPADYRTSPIYQLPSQATVSRRNSPEQDVKWMAPHARLTPGQQSSPEAKWSGLKRASKHQQWTHSRDVSEQQIVNCSPETSRTTPSPQPSPEKRAASPSPEPRSVVPKRKRSSRRQDASVADESAAQALVALHLK